MDAREQRGLEIAARHPIVRDGRHWLVPSQTTPSKRYTVTLKSAVVDEDRCDCPDWETRRGTCKHLHAVRFVIEREEHADGSVTETATVTVEQQVVRTTYPQNWPAYNAAQVEEKDRLMSMLVELCATIEEPEPRKGPGRKRVSLRDQVFAAAFKVYSGFSARRFSCDMKDAHGRGLVSRPLHFNSVLKALENPALTPILYDLIETSALPLRAVESVFAVDSTGFATLRYSRWLDFKHNEVKMQADWVKAHAVIGVKTNVIASSLILDQNAADAPQLPKLVKTAKELGFDIREVTADKAYATNNCFNAVANIGAKLYAPFKSNATGGAGGLYRHAFLEFNLHRDEYLSHYHQRSNIESTFSMVKRKFSEMVRSKTDVAMTNEVLCKFLCHNLCCLIMAAHELGLTPTFG